MENWQHGERRKNNEILESNLEAIYKKVLDMHENQISQMKDLKEEFSGMKYAMSELHQRQTEITLPLLKKIDDVLFKPDGIIAIISRHDACIDKVEKRMDNFPKVVLFIFSIFSALFAAYEWIKSHIKSM